ncbi:IS3 family transposase [Bacillus cereus group sp. N28]|uniref:IS3 family transposase n=1 Tax=Bacillus cereus group sp. N28 TaxID=2794593 RepID=UPI001F5C05D5|nr:IS3 family transposase [Bacillus cereus group sp. N28]
MVKKGGKFQTYSDKLKIQVVKSYLNGERCHSRKGNCHDNACIESFFSHFKSEIFYLNYYQTKEELIQAIEAYIHHYNYKRFQKRLST